MTYHNQLDLSVVIPSYNYGRFIEAAITSVIHQNYRAKEIIVIDDGSTDETKIVVNFLQKAHTNYKIYYYYQNNKGVSVARNIGFKKSIGNYLWFLDADDKLLPDAFEKVFLAIKNNQQADMIFGGYRGISYSEKIHNQIPESLSFNLLKNVSDVLTGKMVGIRPSTTILKRCVMEKIKFPEKVHVEEDALFFGHVFASFKCVSIPAILVEMPRHSDSLRENYKRILESGTQGIEELFEKLPNGQANKSVKQKAYVRRYLKIARKACISHDYKTATQNYMYAIKLRPNSIINSKHLPRMIKSLLMNFTHPPIAH